MTRSYWDFRDVSLGIKKLRDFLLGRKHTLRGRFPPLLSSRSIPPAEIPRGLECKYSNNFYYQRSAMHSVKPPVVAPVASGPTCASGGSTSQMTFHSPPKPGEAWWWDGHCYFESDEMKSKQNSEKNDVCLKQDAKPSGKECGSSPGPTKKPPSPCSTLISPISPPPSIDKVPKEFPIPFLFDSNQRIPTGSQPITDSEWEPKKETFEEGQDKNSKSKE